MITFVSMIILLNIEVVVVALIASALMLTRSRHMGRNIAHSLVMRGNAWVLIEECLHG